MRIVHLPDRLALALQDVVSAVQQGLADAQLRAHLPMVSRRFMAHGVHIYYRCLSGRSAGARYAASAVPAEHLDRARRVVVIADISLDGHWQGLGFFKALIAELCESRQDIDLVEVENVSNARLAGHLARSGWYSRDGLATGGSWISITGLASHSSAISAPLREEGRHAVRQGDILASDVHSRG